jgi:hypothetical protein
MPSKSKMISPMHGAARRDPRCRATVARYTKAEFFTPLPMLGTRDCMGTADGWWGSGSRLELISARISSSSGILNASR